MQGSLGEKVGEGNMADVHAWAPGQVLKLFKAGLPGRLVRHEARMTRAAFAAGAPAPEVLDEVMLEGRFGFVLPRYDGPTLRDLLLTKAVMPERAGEILASLYFAIHKTPAPPEVPSLRGWIDTASRQPGGALPEEIVPGVLTLIDRMPSGDGLCHADLRADNVIMTADGPRIIDWVCAIRAPGVVDIGRAHVSLSELVPEHADPQLPRAVNAGLQTEYARLAGVSLAELTAKIDWHLPIISALVIVQQRPMTLAQRERLIQRIAAALLSEE